MASVILRIVLLILLKALKNAARELRRHVTSWDTHFEVWLGKVRTTLQTDPKRIDLSLWNAPRRWQQDRA